MPSAHPRAILSDLLRPPPLEDAALVAGEEFPASPVSRGLAEEVVPIRVLVTVGRDPAVAGCGVWTLPVPVSTAVVARPGSA
jgi:hypothetical protein